MTVLVDSNVLLDVMTEDPEWSAWSSEALAHCAESSALAINPLTYAEVSVRFDRIEDLQDALPEGHFLRLPLPYVKQFTRSALLLPPDRSAPRAVLDFQGVGTIQSRP